jgi:hypothetical protein
VRTDATGSDNDGVGFDGINTSTFAAGTSIGTVQAISTGIDGLGNIGDDGMRLAVFTAGTSIGDINSTTTGRTGIDDSKFTAGTSIGSVTGSATGILGNVGFFSEGIDSSTFAAGTGIGAITGTTTSTDATANGISESVFRAAGGGIGAITASTASPASTETVGDSGSDFRDSGLAIDASIFSAIGNIASIQVNSGSVNNSRFLAGYDIGSDLTVSASGDLTAASTSIGTVNIDDYLIGTDIIASVDHGGDAVWALDSGGGGSDDVSLGGGSIGAVTLGVPADGNFIAGDVSGTGSHVDHGIEAETVTSVNNGGGGAEFVTGGTPGVIDNNESGSRFAGAEVQVREFVPAGP